MADSKTVLTAINEHIAKHKQDAPAYRDAFELIRNIGSESGSVEVGLAHDLLARIQRANLTATDRSFKIAMYELQRRIRCYSAADCFDDYCLYMEMDRPFDKQFYLPRRFALKHVAQSMDDLAKRKLRLLAVSMPPGTGKALANDTPILTRTGWKRHGDLTVGDEVIGLDGRFKKVVAVHPKCQLDVLVEFTNGEKIQCHENHEWYVFNRHRQKYETLETKVIEASGIESGEPGRRGHRYMYLLPERGFIYGEDKELPVDPYVLGVWLGDGSNQSPRIANPKCDYGIISRIVENGIPIRWQTEHKTTGVMYYDFDIRKQLQSVGMCHSRRRTEKHIPKEYFTASINQRLELLAGLLDTDGTLNGEKYIYTTTGRQLAEDFCALLSTLGWRYCVTKRKPETSSSGIVGRNPVYAISFTPDKKVPCVLPRKQNKGKSKQRRVAIKSIQRVTPKEGNCITVEGDGMYLAGKSMLPTHNTTLALFYLTWLAGRNPEKPNLTGSHNRDFLAGTYGECLRLLDPNGEYLFGDVFPGRHVINTNAKALMIDVGDSKKDMQRFGTLEFTSVGSGNAGKVRAENILYCDDLVDGLETALSKDQLDKLWGMYTTDLRQRKIGDCVELHIATRWSVHDVIGRLEAQYGDSDEAKFIKIPALNENEESNFNYPIDAGFTTKFYLEQREIMDDASWRALFMNEPIEREGQLYPEQELRRYFELPDGEPDAIIAVCDTKDRGKDYCVMPVDFVYGEDHYIDAVLCDNSAPNVVETRLWQTLVSNKVHACRFESNAAGGHIAEKIQNEVRSHGGRTKITTKYTTANKETKILVNAPWIKEHCLFKDKSVLDGQKEYKTFLRFLTGYTMMGKNAHDDVPDAMAMLSEYAQGLSVASAERITNPFSRFRR